ncbi:MAG: acyl-CoA synthetase FdrA [Erysipelothrix sp.]|nr:acyl-CoA synthetase FdrA [Erysipelothrix sp.]
MLHTIIQKNNYQDSINLMLLSSHISQLDVVETSQVMMGTDANKDILNAAGLLSEEGMAASPNDMIIAYVSDDEKAKEVVLAEVNLFLNDLSVKKESNQTLEATDLNQALELLPDANVALFSIPGEYGASEMEKALKAGLHVFSFTDNISIEDERKLKELALEKGLLMMGPDCGTGMISNVPLAFTNVVKPGNISIIGASGTGIQEVMSIVDMNGGGIIHALGTGGRDLKNEIGGITGKQALATLEKHDPTDVIIVISKPPGKEVRDEILAALQLSSKKVVAIFLGEKPESHLGNVYLAHTLEEAALIGLDLANNREVKSNYVEPTKVSSFNSLQGKTIKGLYSGGTLAFEAGMLLSEAFGLGPIGSHEGTIIHQEGHHIIDLGDDKYTQGRPHPMIDPEVRAKMIEEVSKDPNAGVVLLDVVLGYGCHPNMANALKPAIEKARVNNPELVFVASVVGTDLDPQNMNEQVKLLEESGVVVADSNAAAVRLALQLCGKETIVDNKEVKPYTSDIEVNLPEVSSQMLDLIQTKPRVINIGVESFNDSIKENGATSVQFSWRPRAGGNKRMIKLLDALEKYDEEINRANLEVVNRYKEAQPFLVDVRPGKEIIPELNTEQKTLLHAGPPIQYHEMTGPMQGSCIGATLFEGWASNEEDAKKLLESGEVRFIPCHHVGAVGPMGGITSANFPMLVVQNKQTKKESYCIMNEGIGKVLRFGAYSQEVVDRLTWMKEVLGPTLSKALRTLEDGLNLNVIIARAITMGDEFHQRNIAASLIFLKEMAPIIVDLEIDPQHKHDVIDFLAKTDQFFLNIMMATGKSMADYARDNTKGTIVTTMTRNGKDFGIRIAECNDEWFTAPVNTPKGLYFTGYTEEDGNKDIGDSAITETVGVGGMSMIAAPGVTRFVGAGGFEDALETSNEMQKIVITNNPNWSIPTWDFKGAPLGIDIRKVVETQITPIINTGIAHKVAGMGQVGAGTVRAPLACFEKALEAYAKTKGIYLD